MDPCEQPTPQRMHPSAEHEMKKLLEFATKKEKRLMVAMLVATMIDDPRDISEAIGLVLPSATTRQIRDELHAYVV